MPTPYKCNIFFSGPAAFTGQIPNGWSETYYTDQGSLTDAVDEVASLAVSRAALLATPCEIIGARASEIGGNRISQLVAPQAYTYYNPAFTADTSWQAALVHLTTDEGLSRSLMMRGIPDCVYNPDGAAEVAAAADWKAKLANFISVTLVTGPWELYGISKDLTAQPKIPLLDVVQASPTTLTVTASGAAGVAAGDLVHLYNSGIKPPLGNVTVQSTTGASVFVVKGVLQAGFELPVTAYARKIVKDTFGITGGAFERITHRIVGRPFGQQRGARRRRPA